MTTTKLALSPAATLLISTPDLWLGCQPVRTASSDPEEPYPNYTDLSERTRAPLCGLLVLIAGLADGAVPHAGGKPDTNLLRERFHQVLRATHVKTEGKTEAPVVDLESLYLEDPGQRAVFRRLEDELAKPPLVGSDLIRESFRKVLVAGSTVQLLRRRRDAIDEQLSRLERVSPAAKGTTA